MKIKLKYIPTLILTLMAAVSGLALTTPYVGATNPDSVEARVEVSQACSFDDDYSSTFNISAMNGTSGTTESMNRVNPTDNMVHVSCNNIAGFDIKAVGYSPDATHASGYDGNTDMYSSTVSTPIPTGTATSGATSAWAMKVGSASSSTSYTYQNGYNAYSNVPTTPAVSVLRFAGSTSAVVTGTFRPDYQYYISQSQPAGTYTGKVKYTIVAI